MSGLPSLLPAFISLGGSLVGVFLGGYLVMANEEKKRRADFVGRQLTEFYGPIFSLRAEIRERSELCKQIQSVAHNEWKELCLQRGSQQRQDERWPEYADIIEYDNELFQDTIFPMYQTMMSIFREKMCLAEPETRNYFGRLVHYVNIWERHFQKRIPPEVITKINHSEENLVEFYANIQKIHDDLRAELAKSKQRYGLRSYLIKLRANIFERAV